MAATDGDRARIRAIATRLAAHDVRVVWYDGWDTRGVDLTFAPRGIVCHWDASTIASGEWGAIGIIIAGRGGDNPVPPPLSQFQGARCLDGQPKIGVVAAGRANHAGTGGPYTLPDGTVIPQDSANRYMYGTEWAWAGPGEVQTPAAKHAYGALVYAVREVLS